MEIKGMLELICHSDGTYKIIPTWKCRLLRVLKNAGMILGALLMAILFCGAAITSEHPAKIIQAVFLFGFSVFALVAAIVLCVTGGERK